MNIAIACVQDPMSTTRHYIDAFRKVAHVDTFGPTLSGSTIESWYEQEATHILKSPRLSYTEKIDPLKRLVSTLSATYPMSQNAIDFPSHVDYSSYDLFIWIDSGIDFFPSPPKDLECPQICIVGDTHTGRASLLVHYARFFDHIYVQFRKQDMCLFTLAGYSTSWLPPACPSWFKNFSSPSKLYDVGFVGQTHPQYFHDRCKTLLHLSQAGIDLSVHSYILEQYALFLSQCHIGFNCSLSKDFNMRIMETLGSGACLITDELSSGSGLYDFFTPGIHFMEYKTPADCLQKIRSLLNEPGERNHMTESARKKIYTKHTYEHRVDTILSEQT